MESSDLKNLDSCWIMSAAYPTFVCDIFWGCVHGTHWYNNGISTCYHWQINFLKCPQCILAVPCSWLNLLRGVALQTVQSRHHFRHRCPLEWNFKKCNTLYHKQSHLARVHTVHTYIQGLTHFRQMYILMHEKCSRNHHKDLAKLYCTPLVHRRCQRLF